MTRAVLLAIGLGVLTQGDGRLGVDCGYGTCPAGFVCATPPECQGGPGLPCTCQPIP